MEVDELKRNDFLVKKSRLSEPKLFFVLLFIVVVVQMYGAYSESDYIIKNWFWGFWLYMCIYMIYDVTSIASKHQATLGMRKVGIHVTRHDKSKHNFFSALIPYSPFFIGCIVFLLLSQLHPFFEAKDYFAVTVLVSVLFLASLKFFSKKIAKSRRYFIGSK